MDILIKVTERINIAEANCQRRRSSFSLIESFYPTRIVKALIVFFAIFLFGTSGFTQIGRRFPSERRTITDSLTGKKMVALTTSPAQDNKIYQTHPQWTSDGKYIVFRSNRSSDSTIQAFALSEETGEIIQLTEGKNTGTGSLNVARKSNKLYFFRGKQLTELNIDLLLKDSKAGKMKKSSQYEKTIMSFPDTLHESGGLTMDATEKNAYSGVSWKQKGEDHWGIRSIDIATGKITKVIDLSFRVGHMQANPWIPGEILYCYETGGDATQRMWITKADGSENRELYKETPDEWVTHEIWQDSLHVLFNLLGHKPNLRTKPNGIVSVNVRSQHVVLYHQEKGQGFWHCAGSSDGKWVVGDTFDGQLYLINLITGEVKLLTVGHYPPDKNIHSHHTFSPDGKRVLFNSGKLGNPDIMIISVP